jgi:hypothetical protein
VDNPVDGPTPHLVRSHPALRRREGNAVHEGHGETRPRTGWIGEDRTIIARSARRVDAGSGAAPRGTPSQGRRAVGTQARAAPDARHGHPTPYRRRTTLPCEMDCPRSRHGQPRRACRDRRPRPAAPRLDGGDQPHLGSANPPWSPSVTWSTASRAAR